MINIAPMELVVIAVIALIVLGPKRLPDFARSAGRGIREFRAALSTDDDERDDRPAETPARQL